MIGYSISVISYPVDVLNRCDSPYGRCFRSIFELCYKLLNEGVLYISNIEDEDYFEIEWEMIMFLFPNN